MYALQDYTQTSIKTVYERLAEELDYPPTTLQIAEEVYPEMRSEFAKYVTSMELYEIYGLENQLDLIQALNNKSLPEEMNYQELHYTLRMMNLVTFETGLTGVW